MIFPEPCISKAANVKKVFKNHGRFVHLSKTAVEPDLALKACKLRPSPPPNTEVTPPYGCNFPSGEVGPLRYKRSLLSGTCGLEKSPRQLFQVIFLLYEEDLIFSLAFGLT